MCQAQRGRTLWAGNTNLNKARKVSTSRRCTLWGDCHQLVNIQHNYRVWFCLRENKQDCVKVIEEGKLL